MSNSYMGHPNLIANWDFSNPIKRRYDTVSAGYDIERWKPKVKQKKWQPPMIWPAASIPAFHSISRIDALMERACQI